MISISLLGYSLKPKVIYLIPIYQKRAPNVITYFFFCIFFVAFLGRGEAWNRNTCTLGVGIGAEI